MRDLLANLRQVLAQVLQSMRSSSPVRVSARDRGIWRQRLFAGGLRMHMQPIISLQDRRCAKVEALARLQLADGNVLGPGEFLSILSDQELNRLFIDGLHQSLDWLERWQQDGVTMELSFNLPPVTLHHAECVQWIRGALDNRRIAPQLLTFELLENEDITDQQAYTRAIFELHELGVKLAMDDLGSGYSSLLRLRTLPFDQVKIDQGLVRAAEQSPRRSIALVGALVRLAKGLDLRVAVEGLENDELVDLAAVLGADLAQGYALSRPMPAEAFGAWIAARERDPQPPHVPTRMGALAAHWLWEQEGQDRFDAQPHSAHLRCAVGRYLEHHGLLDSPLGAAHAEMHRAAQRGGVKGADYLEARESFFIWFARQPVDGVEVPELV
jgi:EAL domain-containing protein (putative c-di-GMP-specific phosphodiesterase class I)